MMKILKIILLSSILFTVCIYAAIRYATFGVFESLRVTWVTSAMTTQTHQDLAYIFASKDEVERIMTENTIEEITAEQDLSIIYEERPVMSDFKRTGDVGDSFGFYEGYTELEQGIHIKDVSGTGFAGKLMLVEDASRLKVGLTRTPGVRGDMVKQMVAMNSAVAGINGGWFVDPNYEGSGGIPTGFVIQQGKVTYTQSSAQTSIVGFNAEGKMVIGKYTPEEAINAGIVEAMATYPILVLNGQGTITKGDGGWGIAPRTAIGQLPTGEVLLLTVDGRQVHSIGATLKQMQDIFLAEGATNAICLDGGSSTVMFYKDRYLNKPSLGHERYIPTSWLVSGR